MTETPKRLTPTPAVVRRLYLLSGNQCAFPGCLHPIISEDGTYVAEICHIHAAEPGGERFNVEQSNEDRRAFENLLLMCHAHHVVTDDVELYPPDAMFEIKRRHEARFERGLTELESSEGIQITNSQISLGGIGGTAPGAGGGGGGAIGHGARAGDGGSGGRTLELGELGIEALLAAMPSTLPPGAGGGGEGAIGPNAMGGRGGGGGDIVQSFLDYETLVRLGLTKIAVRMGAGGEQGRPAQASGYDLLDDRGNIIISVNAPGGLDGNGAASHPGPLFQAQSIVITRTRVVAAFLASAIEQRNGLFSVLSGGWSTYGCSTLPEECVWPLLIQMSLGGVRPGGSIDIQVVLINPEGLEINLESITVSRDNVHSSPVWIGVLTLRPTITGVGRWTICIRTAREELSSIPIDVSCAAAEFPSN